MKKLFLLSLLFAFVLNMNGQEKKGEKSKTTTEKSTKSKKEVEKRLKCAATCTIQIHSSMRTNI